MLILTRKKGTSIHIGDNIKVHFINTCGGLIKVGVEAPDDILILRDELSIKNKDKSNGNRI